MPGSKTQSTEKQVEHQMPTASIADLKHKKVAELAELARSCGFQVHGRRLLRRPQIAPRTFYGSGQLEALADEAARQGVRHLICDDELTGSQVNAIEKLTGLVCLDRTGLILEIFAARARSHEGKLQVELARLQYLATRLVRRWSHLERQTGGMTRDIERGTRAVHSLISYSLYSIFPTIVEVALVLAGGLTGGLLTTWLLFANGLLLGAVACYCARQEMLGPFLSFVAAHAPGRGGLARSLFLLARAAGLGLSVDLSRLPVAGTPGWEALLFGESAGRLLLAVDPDRAGALEACLACAPFARIGVVGRRTYADPTPTATAAARQR